MNELKQIITLQRKIQLIPISDYYRIKINGLKASPSRLYYEIH